MSILKEAALVDLSDSALKELLGHTYHAIRNLEEEKRNDPEIAQMREALQAYVKDNFDNDLMDFKKRMKAARALAKARGIKWTLPEDAS